MPGIDSVLVIEGIEQEASRIEVQFLVKKRKKLTGKNMTVNEMFACVCV